MSKPTFSRVIAAPFADVTVRADVADADAIRTRGGRLMRPTVIEARYSYDFAFSRWRPRVTVSGRRLVDGVEGSRCSLTYENASQDMPHWLADFVRQQTPAMILPDLGMVNA